MQSTACDLPLSRASSSQAGGFHLNEIRISRVFGVLENAEKPFPPTRSLAPDGFDSQPDHLIFRSTRMLQITRINQIIADHSPAACPDPLRGSLICDVPGIDPALDCGSLDPPRRGRQSPHDFRDLLRRGENDCGRAHRRCGLVE